jgi:hypothetical protein
MAADPMACYCLERDLNKKKKKKQRKGSGQSPARQGETAHGHGGNFIFC